MNQLQYIDDYNCAEYFNDEWSEKGHFNEFSQTQVIVTFEQAYVNEEIGFFAIGRSGADSIDFGYRKGKEGLWAYYPIEDEFKYMASSIVKLRDGWCSGELFV